MKSHNADSGRETQDSIAVAPDPVAGSRPNLPRAFPITEFCRLYGIGRTTAYAEIAAGRLRAVKVGHRTLVTNDAAEAWLASLPELKNPQRSRKNAET
jgi:excisionase family DNA binding protein